MLDTIRAIVGLGPRSPGLLAEAQAAAVVNGKLRNVGMRVVVEPFRIQLRRSRLQPYVTLLAGLLGLSYGLAPLPLTLALLALALTDRALQSRVPITIGNESQSVVATRATKGTPRWRLLLLAPLDAPPLYSPLVQALAGINWGSRLRRVTALLGLLSLALLGLIDGQPIWWYLAAIPAAYLLLVGWAELSVGRAPASPGAASHAACLAVMLAAAEQLDDLRQTELWSVALGATSVGEAALHDFFGRYPFEQPSTLLINLEGIGAGQPTCVTREGLRGRVSADPWLLRMAAAADAADPTINMEPRTYRLAPTGITGLLRQRWRGMSIATLDPHGRVPFRYRRVDVPEQIDDQVLDRTLRLVVGLVRQIDATKEDTFYG